MAPSARDDRAELLAELLERAPVHAVVLVDRELILEAAPGVACALFDDAEEGSSVRALLTGRLGAHWMARIDRTQREGLNVCGCAAVDGTCWEIDVQRLDARRVAFYSRELCALDLRQLVEEAREALHKLKNPIYGIAVATDVLLSQTPEDGTAEVLQHMKAAASQAEHCLEVLSELLTGMVSPGNEARTR